MVWESIQREVFSAFLRRLEERPVDLLLIEVAREIEKAKRGSPATLPANREALWHEARAEIIGVLGRIVREGKRNAFLRTEAVEILGAFEGAAHPVVPALVTALGDEVSFVRVAVCQTLGRIGAKARSAMEPLREALRDEDPTVRRAAAEALQTIGQP